MRNDTGYRILTRPIAVAGVIGWVLLVANTTTGCGQAAVTQKLVECKLDALRVLPDDPAQVTVADAIDVVSRIKACHQPADAGSQ